MQLVRIAQGNVVLYVGVLPASDVLRICSVDAYDPKERPDGYQRPRDPGRCREFADYVANDTGVTPNAILLNLRDTSKFEFKATDGDRGLLEIAEDPSAAWVVDGQHRLGGFRILAEQGDPRADTLVPVVLVEGLDRRQEAALFLVVNSKQKNISPSLKYFDLMKSEDQKLQAWLEGREGELKVRAAALVELLNDDKESPWHQLINLGGMRGLRRPVNLVSFVTALVPLLADPEFSVLGQHRQYVLLRGFWDAVRYVWPEDFVPPQTVLVLLDEALFSGGPSDDPEWWEEWRQRHPGKRRANLLQKTLGVYVLSVVGLDIFRFCGLLREDAPESDDAIRPIIVEYVAALRRHVDPKGGWSPDGDLGNYGGMKGYRALALEFRQVVADYHRERRAAQ